ncbi:MAG TPA: hypothetical protein VII06_15830 [Chloroflexota bacterium]|jgi:hypothetical protein
MTFHDDGTAEASYPTRFAPGQPTAPYGAAHGTWEKTADGEYISTWVALAVDPAGDLAGTITVRSRIRLNAQGNELTLESQTERLDTDGNPISQGAGAVVSARRVVAEAPR